MEGSTLHSSTIHISWRSALLLLVLAFSFAAFSTPARAAFPGANGDITGGSWSADGQTITYSEVGWGNPNSCEPCYYDVYIDDASGPPRDLTPNGEFYDEVEPAFSPDGRQVVYRFINYLQNNESICIVNLDGTQAGCPAASFFGGSFQKPAWSPDGTEIAYVFAVSADSEIWTVNRQSGVSQRLATSASDPDWSPNSTQIVFASNRDGNWEIYRMNRDGTNQTRITTSTFDERNPVWSPDGTKIAFQSSRGSVCNIFTMNVDGTGEMCVTFVYNAPDWRAINPAPYTRPIGTALSRWSLAPTFRPCNRASANGTHGSALSGASCSPPVPSSSLVAVGPRSIGYAQTRTLASGQCAPFDSTHCYPDFTLIFNVTDVRSGSPTGPEYDPSSWDLTGTATLPGASATGKTFQITDRYNQSVGDPSGPYDKSATTTALSFPVPIDCTPTIDTAIGSTCSVATTANTLVPGAAVAGKRAVLEVGQIQLLDRGSDGTPGNADDQVFEAQGLFVP